MKKKNNKMGRPRNKVPTRAVYLKWPVYTADFLESEGVRDRLIEESKKTKFFKKIWKIKENTE